MKSKDKYKVDNAIILAAGFGSRFVPLTYETPKGLLKVKGKPMLEKQIEQLQEVGIDEIIIVVGYMKEAFDYLIDKFGVKLIYNPEFSTKNNLASLFYAKDYVKNSYILMADNWIEKNIFNKYEQESWFSCLYFEGITAEWCVSKVGPRNLIQDISIGGQNSWAIVGPAFFSEDFSKVFNPLLEQYYEDPRADDYYWEHILKQNIGSLTMYMNKQDGNVYEFECLEDLRKYDKSYINNTNSEIMKNICRFFKVEESMISDIEPLKAGITNNSFIFSLNGTKYVYRIPGAGTDKLIDRKNEKKVYDIITPLEFSDEPIYFDVNSGIKISKYYVGSKIVDPWNDEQLKNSMKYMKKIHDKKYQVDHEFDIENMINYYYKLADDANGIRFTDIDDVKENAYKLLRIRKDLNIEEVLCHGDFANTNVLILEDGEYKIIDWEYSGMSDPIMDVAMYGIYAQLPRDRIELCLDYYLDNEVGDEQLTRLYLYVALGGFLWCMWSQYKQSLGQEFGEYTLKMYRYMKDFYKILEDKGVV